jgi:nucleotide-binding universal stress UspA family protein
MPTTKERPIAEVVVRPDLYRTLLVHVEPAKLSSHRVGVAARLARQLDAHLIGLGAETFNPIPTPDAFSGYAGGEWTALVLEQIGNDIKDAETAFRRDAAGADIEWRSVQDSPHHALTMMAHAADLIVVGPRSHRGSELAADPADVVMTAGRPVLLVPDDREHFFGMSAVIAWKNTRECRRAVRDALPFLQRAEDVIVVHALSKSEFADDAKGEIADVVANLKRHGVDARPVVAQVEPEGVNEEIRRIASMNGADLVVFGAYGHTRMREWALGGVTDDFLRHPPAFLFMSH